MNKLTNICPCEECIVMAMCKHKNYSQLMECKIIRDRLYKSGDRMLLMINRRVDFNTSLQALDKLFNTSYTSKLISKLISRKKGFLNQ